MYISRIRIQNYRNFGDPAFEMEFKPFTLILGENNVGKTNLLNALGLIFSQELVMFRKRILELDDFNYEAVRKFREQVADSSISATDVTFPEVKVEVTLTDMDEDQEAVVGDWFTSADLKEAKITYSFAPRANFKKEEWIQKQRDRLRDVHNPVSKLPLVDVPVARYSYSIYGSDNPTNECDPYFLRMLKMEFLDALRDAQREMAASGEYRLLYRILNQREDANYDDIRRILLELQSEMDRNQNLIDIEGEVEQLLELISLRSTEADNKIGFTFTAPTTSEMLRKLSLRYGTDPVTIERNGLGRNNLLFIALILSHLSSRDSYGNEVFFRLIALEEPEAHLHPHLQDHLAKNIESVRNQRNKGMQVLMTSHSTHIASKLSLANTVILYRENGVGPVQSHYVLHGIQTQRGKSSVNYLSRYLDATKSRMLFARKIILVEGFAEQLLIPKLFEIYYSDSLEKVGCNIVNVQGVAFRHFLEVIRNGYYVRCLVLTDRDSGTRTQHRAQTLKDEFDVPGLIQIEISEYATFEMDLIAANCSGIGKQMILDAATATKASRGDGLVKRFADSDLEVDEVFDAIKDSKTDFAFSLASILDPTVAPNFNIPTYIRNGFKFLF